jgi:hypothetical protein
VAGWNRFLHRIDVSRPASPWQDAVLALDCLALDVAAGARETAVACAGGGLVVVRDQPGQPPQVVGRVGRPFVSFERVRSMGAHVLVATDEPALLSVDLAEPAGPIIVGAWPAPGRIQDLETAGDRALVGLEDGAVLVLDASDPARLAPLGQAAVPGSPVALAVHGDGLTVASLGSTGQGWLTTGSIGTEGALSLGASWPLPFEPMDLAVVQDQALISDYRTGQVALVPLGGEGAGAVASRLAGPAVTGLAADGATVYASGRGGFQVLTLESGPPTPTPSATPNDPPTATPSPTGAWRWTAFLPLAQNG